MNIDLEEGLRLLAAYKASLDSFERVRDNNPGAKSPDWLSWMGELKRAEKAIDSAGDNYRGWKSEHADEMLILLDQARTVLEPFVAAKVKMDLTYRDLADAKELYAKLTSAKGGGDD